MGLTKYQTGGFASWATEPVKAALTEIVRAVGVSDVRISAYQKNGVGRHKTGEAGDVQPGRQDNPSCPDTVDVMNEIVKYVVANWDRLHVRYVAALGWEYGGSWGGPERKRRQVKDYGESDPFRDHYVHVDFTSGPIPGANAGIAVG